MHSLGHNILVIHSSYTARHFKALITNDLQLSLTTLWITVGSVTELRTTTCWIFILQFVALGLCIIGGAAPQPTMEMDWPTAKQPLLPLFWVAAGAVTREALCTWPVVVIVGLYIFKQLILYIYWVNNKSLVGNLFPLHWHTLNLPKRDNW